MPVYEYGFVVMNLFENDAVMRHGVSVSSPRLAGASGPSSTSETYCAAWSLDGTGHRDTSFAPRQCPTLRRTVFVVSANLRSAHALRSALQNVGYDVMVSCSFDNAIAAIDLSPDFIGALICFDLPDADALQHLDHFGSEIPILVMSNALPVSGPARDRFYPIFPDAAVCTSSLLELGLCPEGNRMTSHRSHIRVSSFSTEHGELRA